MREGCYPGTPGVGVCEGSARELREPTVYNTGDYEQWTRVTVVIPRNVAARYFGFAVQSEFTFALSPEYVNGTCIA